MKPLYILGYLVIELAAFVLMVKFLGLPWAILISIAAAVVGFLVLRSQGRKVFGELRRASRNEVDARAPLTDTALLAAASILMVIPGIVSTVLGTVLLIPPVRKAVRPAVMAFGAVKFAGAVDRAGLYATGVYGGGQVIDGTVVDVPTYDPTGLPDRPLLPRGH